MAEAFTYGFTRKLPSEDYMQEWDRYLDEDDQPLPLLSSVVEQAVESIEENEVFKELPSRNKELVLDMAAFMIASANFIKGEWADTWMSNYWGLYIVGSRARGEAQSDSDLDLLSVGTFYRNQAFRGSYLGVRKLHSGADGVFDGFDLTAPDELPDEYNVGAVDRKYLLRATPKIDPTGIKMRYPKPEPILPVDLNVVDLTFIEAGLEDFKTQMDVDEDGVQLPRIPLVEVATIAPFTRLNA